MCHYSLSWAKDERPDRQEMKRAAAESLKALGLEKNQALIVSHRDGQPHVHVIANRVDPESGKAAGLSRSKLRLSKWAEGYEREQGKIRCPMREINNDRRSRGERVVDGRGGRRSGSWRVGASGSGRRFTGVNSGSGSSWGKTAVGCWGASGCGGSWAVECERSAGRSGDARKCWGALARS